MGTREYRSAAKGESWKFRLMNTIDQCMKYAETKEEFISLMESEGYQVRWTDSRKNITYTTPEGMKCRDDRLHETKYTKEVMEREFRIRAEIISGGIETAEPISVRTDDRPHHQPPPRNRTGRICWPPSAPCTAWRGPTATGWNAWRPALRHRRPCFGR